VEDCKSNEASDQLKVRLPPEQTAFNGMGDADVEVMLIEPFRFNWLVSQTRPPVSVGRLVLVKELLYAVALNSAKVSPTCKAAPMFVTMSLPP